MEMSEYIFIYGTLSPELVPDEIADAVGRLEHIADGFVYGELYDLGDFPGAKLGGKPKTKIRGSVYQLPSDQRTIRSLDAYEEFIPGNPNRSLYLRKKIPVNLENGKTIEAWIYEYNGDTSFLPVIEGGDYSKIVA